MGKKSNDRRRKLFADLEQSGKVKPPPPPPRRVRSYDQKIVFAKNPETIRRGITKPICCKIKYAGNLPSLWRPCGDCPLDSDDAV